MLLRPIALLALILLIASTGCSNRQKYNSLDNLPDSLVINVNSTLWGNDRVQQLSFISQNDQLDSTKFDAYRCSAAAAINCYLYMGGSWEKLASTLALPDTAFTYANVYWAQEKLFLLSGGNFNGILGQYYPTWDKLGELTGYKVKSNNLLSFVFENLDMYIKPLLPIKISDPEGMKEVIRKMYKDSILPTPVNDFKDKKELVLNYFKSNPNGALFMGVYENSKTGESLPAKDERISSQNHYIMCFKRGSDFYTLDTWRAPGHKALTKLTDKKVEEMLYRTHNMLLAMYFK
ncbi:MAG: hypothetical protein EBS55_07725 [Flavobacteriaceae bacterium]|nr:hypothetical protein [Flavobacteriaceae bacterium]